MARSAHLRTVLLLLPLVVGSGVGFLPPGAGPARAIAADPPALPAAVTAKLAAFRAVPWGERLRPERPDPAPDGWQARLAAEWALASLDAATAPALLPLLADEDRFVRAIAAKAVGIARPAGATEALAKALAAEKDKGARIALVEALGRTGGPGALEAVEGTQVPGADADLVHVAGLARRQLKGQAWDLDSIRGEFAEAGRTKLSAAAIDAPGPELALPSADGVVNLSKLRGKIVILVFTAGDRGAADAKALARLTQEKETFERLGVAVVVVAPHEKERVKIWAEKQKLPFTFAADPSGRAQGAWGVARQLFSGGEWIPSPAWCVLDAEGVLRWRRIGRRPDDQASLGELLPVLEAVHRGMKPQ
jgi:peroxiredoxin